MGNDNSNGWMHYEGCIQPGHVFLSCVTLLQPAIHSKEFRFFSSFFSFLFVLSLFLFFYETAGAPPRGFHPHCLPWAPPRGFHPEIFYSFVCFFTFSLFFPFFLLLFAQGVGGVETGTCSTTNTILPIFSMNSCLERGFL